MAKYDIGIIDAEWNLRRLWCVAKSKNSLTKSSLERVFIQSILKFKREMDFARPLLLWDKTPYYKIQEVTEYKQDRQYTTEDDVALIKQRLQDPSLTESERRELQDRLNQAEQDVQEFKIRCEVKYDIIGNGRGAGFISLIKTGFEADDLAFAVTEKVRKLGKTAILITTDHDWVSFRSPEVDYSTPKFDHRNGDCRSIVLDSRRLNLPMYEIGVLKEIYYSSHNNVTSYEFSEKVDFDTFCTKLTSGDESLEGFEKASKVYNAMNMRKHLPELENLINFSLSECPVNMNDWNEFMSNREIRMSYSRFTEYTKDLEQSFL